MTLPNIITMFRIVLIPVYLAVFYSGNEGSVLMAGLIFMVAGISDVADGYIARRFNLMSKLGAVLDPFADKLMSFTVLITFTSVGLIPIWVLIPMLIKEIVMLMGGAVLYFKHDKSVIPSNKYGKIATFSLYAAIFTIIIRLNLYISIFLLTVTVLLNIIAFTNYLKVFKTIVYEGDEKVDK